MVQFQIRFYVCDSIDMHKLIPTLECTRMSFFVCICQFFTHKVSRILRQKYLKYFESTKFCLSFVVRLCMTMQD